MQAIRRAGGGTLLATLIAALVVGFGAPRVHADGTETLGPPSIAIAPGTGFVIGGTGTRVQPASITVAVPAGAAVVQVLAYWEGMHSAAGAGADNTVVLGGTPVTGTLIGGPTFIATLNGVNFFTSTYRADVTALGLVAPGNNTVAVSGMTFDVRNDGVGLVAVLDDGGVKSELLLRDGNDWAFINSPPGPLQVTVPQTVTFTAAATDRVANLAMFASSVQELPTRRPSIIEVTVGGKTTIFGNVLRSVNGNEWDSVNLPITIPAGATSLTMRVISDDPAVPKTGDLPASLVWNGLMLAVPGIAPPPPPPPPPTTTAPTTTEAPITTEAPTTTEAATAPPGPTSPPPSVGPDVLAPQPPPLSTISPQLPATGSNTTGIFVAGLILTGLGGMLLLARRSRRHA